MTSVHRDGRFLVGVVLGGRSAFERDAHMRALIDANIRLASSWRTAPALAERGEAKEAKRAPLAVALAKPPVRAVNRQAPPPPADPTPTGTARVTIGSSDPIRPLLVKTISYHTVTVRSASMAPMPVLVPAGETGKIAAEQTQAAAQSLPAAVEPVQHSAEPAAPAPRTSEPLAANVEAHAVPVEAHAAPVEAPRFKLASSEPTPGPVPANAARAPAEAAKAAPVKQAAPLPAAPSHAHKGWVIQIGAFDGEQEAHQHLSDARVKAHAALAAADPFTERVQKGDKTLYRARFAGFDRATAEAACRQLKRSDFACLTLKD